MAHQTEQKVIEAAREAQGMSLRAFAAELNVSHVAISHWENGEANVDLNRAVAWLGDDRGWVRQMAIDLLCCKIPDLRDAFQKYAKTIV
jgi:transcriptional regulator with XRE-family HTH domain